ncbi:hypothetical protein N7466_005892 [Penicillium verhagenii]|uniref:uncharacterized protein n=1 Tax=Penicillium verhagenii TaxID=1562060 RepID=UPI002545AFF7|nr:uncharacterized protein N7466_005892 [Penicillium verhagenii]KAJ5930399.1 hypothetical protein N7466_005892 [Penicillium verhagenii]
MRPHHTLLAICSLLGLSNSSPTAPGATRSTSPSTDPVLKNANHIFNVIQDSMRQWGSSLHHNGVSFFLATVPAGTQFYHGTSLSVPVNGTEWLAFEPEHALVFARPHRGPPPGRHDGDEKKPDGPPSHDELRRRLERRGNEDQEEEANGYLHTYAAAKDLRLLYIDGMSAGKTDKGTLDSQDVLLFNNSLGEGDGHGGNQGERARAMRACQMAEDEWAGRIDGLLRMEAGFEIILCSFARDLTPLRIIQTQSIESSHGDRSPAGPGPDAGSEPPRGGPGGGGGPGGPGGPGGGPGGPDSSRWARAVASRYEGIGGHRVRLNFDSFVTAFSHELDLFPTSPTMPRLAHLDSAALEPLRTQLTETILTHEAREVSWDWQATTDMVVLRYADELSYFVSERMASVQELREQITMLVAPFVDYSERNITAEAERCAVQFVPFQFQEGPGMAARAVHGVTYSVCLALLEAGREEDLGAAKARIQETMTALDWTAWKKCRGCLDSEICVVPIWPMGSISDYEKPQCRDALSPYDREGESYWGHMRH